MAERLEKGHTDTPSDQRLGDRIIRVNHAGERGAISIYSGQIFMARLTASDMVEQLRSFRSHEQRHREIFETELKRRGTPRCPSYWLCGLGGLVACNSHFSSV